MTMTPLETLINLVGGVALLLWGVRMIRTGMLRAFGTWLRTRVGLSTRNRGAAFGIGVVLAGLLQSSTAAALIVSSFAVNKLLAESAALAVMLGADVGTTLAAQVFSFNPGAASALLIATGVFAFLGSSGDKPRHVARIFIGLGLLLLSLRLIGLASVPLRESAAITDILSPLAAEPILALLVAAAITWLVHSSLAVVLLIVTLTAGGVILPALGLTLVLGANIGGAIAPLVAQSNAAPLARRVPLGNLLMRAVGVAFVLPFLAPIQGWLTQIDADAGRLMVNFHTAFNVAVALVFLPLVGPVSRLCRRMLPDAKKSADTGAPRYLDPGVIDSPTEALACAARETLHLGDHVAHMLRDAMHVLETDDARLTKDVEQRDDIADRLYEAIKLYLIKVSTTEMNAQESRRYMEILTFTINLEHMGDIIDKNLMELAAKKRKHRYAFSPEGWAELKAFHTRVLDNMQLACNVFMSSDLKLARRLLAEKSAIRELELAAGQTHFDRLRQGRADSIETSSIHMDIIRDLKRINSHLTSVAYPILEAHGELHRSRLRETPARARKPRSAKPGEPPAGEAETPKLTEA